MRLHVGLDERAHRPDPQPLLSCPGETGLDEGGRGVVSARGAWHEGVHERDDVLAAPVLKLSGSPFDVNGEALRVWLVADVGHGRQIERLQRTQSRQATFRGRTPLDVACIRTDQNLLDDGAAAEHGDLDSNSRDLLGRNKPVIWQVGTVP